MEQYLNNGQDFLEEVQQKIQLIKSIQIQKEQIDFLCDQVDQQDQELIMKLELIQEYQQRYKEIKSKMVLKGPIDLSVNRIHQYYLFCLPYLILPQDYGSINKNLPWSFGYNFAQQEEIRASQLYYRYSENPRYLQLHPPQIHYLGITKKNVMNIHKENEHNLKINVKEFVLISIVPSQTGQELINKKYRENTQVIFTMDGTEPTLTNFSQESPNSLSISQDLIIKTRSFQKGMIESQVLTMTFSVTKEDQQVLEFTHNMVRPMCFLSDDSQDKKIEMSEFEEELLQNDNFVSWQENPSFAASRDTQINYQENFEF